VFDHLAELCKANRDEARGVLSAFAGDAELARAILSLPVGKKLDLWELAWTVDVPTAIADIRKWNAQELLAGFSEEEIRGRKSRKWGALDWDRVLVHRYELALALRDFRNGRENPEGAREAAAEEGSFFLSEMSECVKAQPDCVTRAILFVARAAHRQQSPAWITDRLPALSGEQILSLLGSLKLSTADAWLMNLVLKTAADKAGPWLEAHWHELVPFAAQHPEDIELVDALQWTARVAGAQKAAALGLKVCREDRILETLSWVRKNDPPAFERYVRQGGPAWLAKLSSSALETLGELCSDVPDLKAMVRRAQEQSEAQAVRRAIEKIRAAGKLGALPLPQRVGNEPRQGVSVFQVDNNTSFTLTIYFDGPEVFRMALRTNAWSASC
jgi:hypothetical protein